MKKGIAFAVMILGWLALPSYAFSPRIYGCTSSKADGLNAIRCEIDAQDNSQVDTVLLRPASGGKPTSLAFQTGPSENSPSVIALMINRGLEPVQFQAAAVALKAIAQNDMRYVQLGLWQFATDLSKIAAIGTQSNTIRAALDGIKPGGRTVELLRSAVEVNRDLQANSAMRRIMVIASDGEIDDTAYNVAEVAKTLRDGNVRVVVLLPTSGAQNRTDAQKLRRLADETGGLFLEVSTAASAQAAAQKIKRFIDNSGFVPFTLLPESATLELTLKDGKSASYSIPAAAKVPSGPENSGNASPPSSKNADRGFLRALEWYYFAGGGFLLVALLGFVLWRIKRNKQEAEIVSAASPEPEVVGDLRPIFGWFEFLDTQGTREPITHAVMRIGRSADNELVLKNSSVHRAHAVLKKDSAGAFFILDLDTENGVTVNGRHVKNERINDGDVIELGEVRMRLKLV